MSDFDKQSVVDWLHNLTRLGIKLGLKNITELLARIGNPQDSFKSVHVAGSDGKGSTCAYIYSALMEAGINVGLYSSPQIVDFNERISVNGVDISDDEFLLLAYEVMVVVESMKEEGYDCTFFESTTALAFLYFQKKGVECAVIEVGMGGRFDATNVISPEVTVITNISREHTQFLGNSISEIASEKAGIVKRGVPVITCNSGPALTEIKAVAESLGSELVIVRDVSLDRMCQTGSVITYRGETYEVGIPGSYQAINAAMAIEAISRLSLSKDVMPSLKEGLRKTVWRGRMEKVDGLPLIIDVTHTKNGMVALSKDILEIYGKVTVVFGILSDKDLAGISECIARMATQVFVTEPDSDRAMRVSEVARVMGLRTDDVIVSPSVEEAIDTALENMKGSAVLVTGSFRMAEGAMRWLKKKSVRF